jgi:hypothetical protein
VWRGRKDGQFDLVQAGTRDEVYRSYPKKKRDMITRVEEALPTSVRLAREAQTPQKGEARRRARRHT